MAHPRWRAGRLSTGFIAEEFPDGFHPHAPDARAGRSAGGRRRRHRPRAGRAQAAHFRPDRRAPPSRARASARSGSASSEYRLEVKRENGAIDVRFPDKARPAAHIAVGLEAGRSRCGAAPSTASRSRCRCAAVPNGFALAYRGVETKAYVYTEREAGYARLMPVKKIADTGKLVLCPMPGLVVSIAVKEGQEVKAGETVAVVEAMKMENVLRAESDGTVKKIHAKPGDSLAVDAVIMEFA